MTTDMNNSTLTCQIPERISGHWLIVLTVVGGVVGVISVIGNGIILLAFITTKALRKPSNLLLTNLSLSDLLFGLLGLPMYVVTDYVHELYCNAIFYPVRIFTLYLLMNMQLNNITLIAVERFIGIEFPYIYRSHVTTWRMFVVTCSTWLFGMGRALLIAFVMKDNILLGASVELPLAVLLVVLSFLIYCRVYYVSKRHLKEDQVFGIRNQESKSQVAVQIAVFNALTFVPVILVRFVDSVIVDTLYLKQVTVMFPLVGTCFNLAIYTYRMREYRDAVKRLFGRRKRHVVSHEPISGSRCD